MLELLAYFFLNSDKSEEADYLWATFTDLEKAQDSINCPTMPCITRNRGTLRKDIAIPSFAPLRFCKIEVLVLSIYYKLVLLCNKIQLLVIHSFEQIVRLVEYLNRGTIEAYSISDHLKKLTSE